MSIQNSYACFGCVDFANNARTLAYFNWACATGRFEDSRCIPNVNRWICYCDNDGLPTDYTDPITDNACWYDPLIPESADFLGVIIMKTGGLRSSTFTREIVDGISGGSILQQPLVKGKQLVFEVILLSTSCAGMDYGIQWLRRQLEDDTRCPKNGSSCASCQGQLLTIRVHCGDPDTTYDTGLHSFVSAGTIDGVSLVEDDYPMGRVCCCQMRRAVFTMQTESADSYSTLPVSTCMVDASESYIFSRLGNCSTEIPAFPCCPFCSETCDPCSTDPACDCATTFVLEPETIGEVAPCFGDPVCRCVGAACITSIPSGYEAALRLSLFAGSDPGNPVFSKFGLRNVVFRIFENPQGLACPTDGLEYDNLTATYGPCAQIGVSWVPPGSNLIIDGLSGKSWLLCDGSCLDHSERVFSIDGSVFPLKARCTDLVITVEFDCLNVQQNNVAPAYPSTATIETFIGFKL